MLLSRGKLLMFIEITEDDIVYAEKLLLPAGQSFNDERRAFIRCMESRDVIACPGSGKTTALLAKLVILARKVPFEENRGICVLTHTNVAIDEIKRRAGHAADVLFQYPNFFGTIQSFVNQFLAIPGYKSEFGNAIVAIDNDRFFAILEKMYLRGDYGFKRWMEEKGGISTLGNYWFHPETLKVGRSLDEPIKNLVEHTPTHQKITDIRMKVLKSGFLSFNDAYSIALRYIHLVPTIHQAFQNRFCMVFLDEAQDTYEHQFRILDAIFLSEKTLIQRIGDPNQAIFNSDKESDRVWEPKLPLFFSASYRYGDKISRLLSSIRLHDDISLQVFQSCRSYPPQLITFLPGEEHQVLQAFVKLVHKFELSENPCYAIGWIGKDKTDENKLCIPAYFPQFNRYQKHSNMQFSNLISYAAYAIKNAKTESLKHFFEVILQGVADALDDAGIKIEESHRCYTPYTVEKFLKSQNQKGYNEFRSQITVYYLLALDSCLGIIELRDSIKALIVQNWSINDTESFLISDNIDFTNQPDTKEPINQFISDSGIVVNVGTVHSVKGETHAATLYLETDYYGTDAKRLINFLKGERNPSELKKKRHIYNLKVVHVAFSRPKHLLAFACQALNVDRHKIELNNNGWEIHSVSELICDREQV